MHMRDNEMSHQTCFLQFEICHDLGGYFVRARMRNNDLSDSTKKEIVAQYKNSLRSDMEEVSSSDSTIRNWWQKSMMMLFQVLCFLI